VPGFRFLDRLHGTGFFISNDGFCLTARHVIEVGGADCDQNGGELGICPIKDDGAGSWVAKIIDQEFAPEPFDIALLRTQHMSHTFFRINDCQVDNWKDVATSGYPAGIVRQEAGRFFMQQRAHKGYIQRLIPPNTLPNKQRHPRCFELSFPITLGLSGSPLFVHAGSFDYLVGVCVGTVESRIVAYETLEYQDNAMKLHEKVAKIEEFGIAESMDPLLDWKPRLFGGPTLREYSSRVWRDK
jgi:hypothetical protein